MKLFQYSFLILFLATFAGCKNNEEKFIREWQSKKITVPGKSFIKINSNHTFEYKSAGCDWRNNSFGNWEVINDTLVLNSNPSKECQITHGFVSFIKPLKKGEVYEPETTIKGCKPEQGKGAYINFKNDKFYIKNDTLEYVTNIKFPFNDRIAFFIKK